MRITQQFADQLIGYDNVSVKGEGYKIVIEIPFASTANRDLMLEDLRKLANK